MKTILFISILIVFVFLMNQCSSNIKDTNLQSNNKNLSTNTRVSNEKLSDSGKAKKDFDHSAMDEIWEHEIKSESKRSNIPNLKEVNLLASEVEMRIWVGFGRLYPRCFIMNTSNKTYKAYYISPKKVDIKTGGHVQEKVLMKKTMLKTPVSGWNKFTDFLKEQGIGNSIELSLDKEDSNDLDGEYIVIELKKGSYYSWIFFPVDTESTDGQKVLNVCKRIEQDFKVTMGCNVFDNS